MILEDIVGIKGFLARELDNSGNEIARGTLYILRNRNPRPSGFIEDIFVEQYSRGEGYGLRVMERLIKTAKEEDCYKVVLGVREQNSRALSLYKFLEFKEHDLGMRLELK